MLTCSYNNQEFFRVGYYVNNVYDSEELNNNLPETVQFEHVVRNILSDKPRITKFNINWDSEVAVIPSYNNYNFMFDEGKKTSENIQNNFFNCNVYNNSNAVSDSQTGETQLKNIFSDINNNKI